MAQVKLHRQAGILAEPRLHAVTVHIAGAFHTVQPEHPSSVRGRFLQREAASIQSRRVLWNPGRLRTKGHGHIGVYRLIFGNLRVQGPQTRNPDLQPVAAVLMQPVIAVRRLRQASEIPEPGKRQRSAGAAEVGMGGQPTITGNFRVFPVFVHRANPAPVRAVCPGGRGSVEAARRTGHGCSIHVESACYNTRMSLVHIDRIRESVLNHAPVQLPTRDKTRLAAVALVLRAGEADTEALFILRARKEGDPWSGQMAFPGGHLDPGDESLRHAAERETHEEIGLDLSLHGDFIGQIDPVRANPRGRDLDMVVTPFVYELKQHDVRFAPNYEVADVLWGSLYQMHVGHALTRGEFVIGGKKVSYPGYGVGEEIVWGLTYRMLDMLFAMLDPDWEAR